MRLYLYYFLVGFTWTPAYREILQDESPFELINCEVELEFTFDVNGAECFPRKISQTSQLADFGICSIPNVRFQTEEIQMSFDTVDFNWFASPHTDKVKATYSYF